MAIQQLQQYIPSGVTVEYFGNVAVFEVAASEMLALVRELYVDRQLPLKLMDVTDERAQHKGFKVWYVFGVPGENAFVAPVVRLGEGESFVSIVSVVHEAMGYEKKIRAFFGLAAAGLPDVRPVLLHENWPADLYPLRKDFSFQTRPKTATGAYKFQEVRGEGIYEIPVGPIHAGIIGPGHFRFSVAGEEIILLEPKLGYSHRGVEKLFEERALSEQVRLAEKVSGDSSFGHSLAFCQAVEQLAGITPPSRARYLRVIFAELERLTNHFGDLGFIMLDTGFNFGGAQGARLREHMMRINEHLSGSRFLRGINVIGGVAKDVIDKRVLDLPHTPRIAKDFSDLIEIAENSITLLNRLKGTGVLARQVAKDYGVVGVAGRATGLAHDVRVDFPYAAYGDLADFKVASEQSGDVYARFRVRVKEVISSLELIRSAVKALPEGSVAHEASVVHLARNAVAVSCVEGWRGEIVYVVHTDGEGRISRVMVRDPSALNWSAIPFSAAGMMVPDFPVINKSYNLSYSGNDL